jgi:hypothetical protein
METTEDDDLQLLRASVSLVDGVNLLLPRLLWKAPTKDTKKVKVHRLVRQKDLEQLILKVIKLTIGLSRLAACRLSRLAEPLFPQLTLVDRTFPRRPSTSRYTA